MRYALIDNGIVTNVIALNDRDASDFPDAVRLGDLPVGIGDTYVKLDDPPVGIGGTYIDGKFYRDGVEVLTPMEQAQAEMTEYKAALNELGVETEEAINEK